MVTVYRQTLHHRDYYRCRLGVSTIHNAGGLATNVVWCAGCYHSRQSYCTLACSNAYRVSGIAFTSIFTYTPTSPHRRSDLTTRPRDPLFTPERTHDDRRLAFTVCSVVLLGTGSTALLGKGVSTRLLFRCACRSLFNECISASQVKARRGLIVLNSCAEVTYPWIRIAYYYSTVTHSF